MCMSSPDIPPPPAPVQEAKAPELNALVKARKTAASGMGAGTLLTSPSGISANALNVGTPTLLGS